MTPSNMVPPPFPGSGDAAIFTQGARGRRAPPPHAHLPHRALRVRAPAVGGARPPHVRDALRAAPGARYLGAFFLNIRVSEFLLLISTWTAVRAHQAPFLRSAFHGRIFFRGGRERPFFSGKKENMQNLEGKNTNFVFPLSILRSLS